MALKWNTSTLPATAYWTKIKASDGILYAIGGGNIIKSSDGGQTWISLTRSSYLSSMSEICPSGNLLLVNGQNSEGNQAYSYSTDYGATYTYRKAFPIGNPVLIKTSDRFLAVSQSGANIAYTMDGNTWANFGAPVSINTRCIAYGAGKVIVLPYSGTQMLYSTNNGHSGSWTAHTISTTNQLFSDVEYGNGKFVAVRYNSNLAAYSTDGLTWDNSTMPTSGNWNAITCDDNGTWYAVGENIAAYSHDGVNWSSMSMPSAATWRDIACVTYGGKNHIVAVAENVNVAAMTVPNLSPSVPSSITVPSTIRGGSTATITWGAATDDDGNLAGYQLERRVASGTWEQIYRGSLRTFTDTITFGWASVTYRVKAYDTENAESGYTTSSVVTVTNNTAPTISGTDGNLGAFTTAFTAQTYIIADAQNDTVTVVERVDGVQKRSYTPTLGISNTFSFTADEWQQVLNGSHTITITATDSAGLSNTRTWTFTKAMNTFTFTLNPALPADTMPDRCVVGVKGNFPTSSTLTIKVCNNGNDASPTWEDVSTKLGQKHFFTNTTKTATNWGFGLQCTLTRGSATEAAWLDYINVNYR